MAVGVSLYPTSTAPRAVAELEFVRRNHTHPVNGKDGDHPITDIVIHHTARFGEPLDSQIRQLGELTSYHRLCDWFEAHWSLSAAQLQPLVAAKLEEALRESRERGWEPPST